MLNKSLPSQEDAKRKAGGSSGDNTSVMRNVNLLQEV